MKTTISITRKRGKTIVENDKGHKWSFENMDDATAIASLVFFTINNEFNRKSLFSDNFSISLSMESEFLKP